MAWTVWKKIRSRELTEEEWVAARDGVTRAFFAAYFFLSSLQWYLDRPLFQASPFLNRYFPFLTDDLSGKRTGIDVSRLFLDLTFLKASPAALLLLAVISAGCALLLRRRLRAAGTVTLLVSLQVLAYAIGRRSINFDMLYLAFAGYAAGLVFEARAAKLPPVQRAKLPWLLAISTLGCLYGVAFLSKWHAVGLAWADSSHVGGLLRYGRFRVEVGSSVVHAPAAMIDYFSRPRMLASLALLGTMFLELAGFFVFLLGDYAWLYAAMMALLHLMMLICLGIIFRSVVGFLVILALPWNLLGRSPPSVLGWRVAIAPVLGVNLIVALLCWFVPSAPDHTNAALIWPFSRFNMFAGPSSPFSAYYFRDERGKIVDPAFVRRELRVSVGSLNSMLLARFHMRPPSRDVAEYACRFVQSEAPADGNLRHMRLLIWARFFHFDDGRWAERDELVGSCG